MDTNSQSIGKDSYSKESGSFRDSASRVFYSGGEVYRSLSPEGLNDWQQLASKDFFKQATGQRQVVSTEFLDANDAPALDTELLTEQSAVLHHERVPFVSYPYEWTFSMLQDAALLQLELLLSALEDGMTMKDASSYNVQWFGASPTFIDVGSFEALREGEPWVGYRQFCMLYLFPLMLQAYKGVDFHAWLRGSIDGISPTDMSQLTSFRDRFRKGVFAHVYLHAKLEDRYQDQQRDTSKDLKKAGFKSELIKANVKKLQKIVKSLSWQRSDSEWSNYREIKTYSSDENLEKERFIAEVSAARKHSLVWDLGCNEGNYAKIAAKSSDYVLAVDADHLVVDHLYRSLKQDGSVNNVLPLTMSITDPSPSLGWRGLERKDLVSRGKPDLVLALALIHHICITHNVPVREFVDWLASLQCSVVIEFVKREDPMAKRLLAAKRSTRHDDYTQENFESCIADSGFTVEKRHDFAQGTRTLYQLAAS